ncbi:uncharacterized protein N0V89_006973 [Didymosphaeria variabile]|uniref:Xylanolytic transcriptional activator regulatory domain-containing protein n=1 Tax=Didymosphaeria variabile TaxID=1932322 RepID=A0A9W8XI09_9PLEO|nr:uncharacterized protein N0V89_006973 [Didymosphaeria variabile]KAJ4351630.1 hypothetical protein N0V89_006973 [Didymosphaeria variabile]
MPKSRVRPDPVFLVPPPKPGSGLSSDRSLFSRLERLETTVLGLQQELRTVNVLTAAPPTPASSHHPNSLGGETNGFVQEGVGYLENIGTRDDALVSVTKRKHMWMIDYKKLCNMSDSVTYEIKTMRLTYLRLNDATSIVSSSVAVLLSLFALGAFFSEPSRTSEIARTEAESITLAKVFSKGAWDVLDYSRRTSSGTLEDVQAYILTSHALSHIDGFSSRCRMLFSSAVSLARDLQLHRLDECEDSTSHTTYARLMIEKEIKRRVFWYIASEDWLQSTISGPQEGTYWIQGRYIKVKLPRDCTDDDLVLGDFNSRRSGDAPTHMMVFLERIRLAHICREITDTVPLNTNTLLQMPYERIIALDQKLAQFLATMPRLLQYDSPNNKLLESIYPQLPSWRYCIAKTALSRRWKLNQPFLLRQNLDPRYGYSRRACVESAQAVIRGYASLKKTNEMSTLLTRMGIAVHFTHLALSVLIMDLCFNKRETDVAQIKEDITTAFSIFADAPTVSPLLAKSLASLKAVLQQNNIELAITSTDMVNKANNSDEVAHSVSETTEGAFPPHYDRRSDLDTTTDPTFDTYWNIALQNGGEVDLSGWDDLFSSLDTRLI